MSREDGHNEHYDSGAFTPEDRRMLRRINQFITGGDNPSDGAIVRMDRLEQKSARGDWWARTALGAALAAVVASVWSLLTGRHP